MTLAVVTGGESGIGAACAVRLAEAGATARGFEPLLVPPPATDRAPPILPSRHRRSSRTMD